MILIPWSWSCGGNVNGSCNIESVNEDKSPEGGGPSGFNLALLESCPWGVGRGICDNWGCGSNPTPAEKYTYNKIWR